MAFLAPIASSVGSFLGIGGSTAAAGAGAGATGAGIMGSAGAGAGITAGGATGVGAMGVPAVAASGPIVADTIAMPAAAGATGGGIMGAIQPYWDYAKKGLDLYAGFNNLFGPQGGLATGDPNKIASGGEALYQGGQGIVGMMNRTPAPKNVYMPAGAGVGIQAKDIGKGTSLGGSVSLEKLPPAVKKKIIEQLAQENENLPGVAYTIGPQQRYNPAYQGWY